MFVNPLFLLFVLTLPLPSLAYAEEGKRSCSYDLSVNIFDPPKWPLGNLEAFANGQLGIVKPTYDHFYLLIAYRTLSGLHITNQDIARMAPHDPCWNSNVDGWYGYDPARSPAAIQTYSEWSVQRNQVKGVGSLNKTQSDQVGSVYGQNALLNCKPDVFRNASTTLKSRLASYGPGPDLVDWVHAQDQVFTNCSAPVGPLDAVAESAPLWLKHDRVFQQASADFYAGRYAEAMQRFDQITSTPDSPWNELAPYMAARTLIRFSFTAREPGDNPDPEKLNQARIRLLALLEKPLKPELRKDVRRLLQFVQLRINPNEVRLELDKSFDADQLSDAIGQDITDFWYAYTQSGGAGEHETSFSFWLATLRGNKEPETAFLLWQKTRKLPWLIAALIKATPSSTYRQDLLTEANGIPASSPAYQTIRFHLIRLSPDPKLAIRMADELIGQKNPLLSVQDINHVKHVAMSHAQSLAEFIRFAPRQSVFDVWGRPPVIDKDSHEIINMALPLDVLMKAWEHPGLPKAFKYDLTTVIWTRALVLGRWDISRKITNTIKMQIPEAQTLIDDMLATTDRKTMKALGALMTARYPGLVGNISTKIVQSVAVVGFDQIAFANMHVDHPQEGQRANWWCDFSGGKSLYRSSDEKELDPVPPNFLTKKERSALIIERKHLITTPDATSYLGNIVMNWANEYPRDPRLPQSLHMLVRSSRGGCVSDHDLSKKAFQHLHRYFPNDPWTKKTRVHYSY